MAGFEDFANGGFNTSNNAGNTFAPKPKNGLLSGITNKSVVWTGGGHTFSKDGGLKQWNTFSANNNRGTDNKSWEPIGDIMNKTDAPKIAQFLMAKPWGWLLERSKAHFSDIIDRLNCHIVPAILMVFITLISADIVGFLRMEPMRCLRSDGLNDEQHEYALDYCQSKNTYYVAPDEGIPWSDRERMKRQLGYYHWVPLMLFMQQLLFMLPNWLWKWLNQQSGIQFIAFLEKSTQLKHLELIDPQRPKLVRELAEHIKQAVFNREVYYHRRLAGCRVGHCMGSYVSFLYLAIKFLYLLNVTAQFFILNAFIGTQYRWWGLEVLTALMNGENWQDSPIFPRLTLCDVPIRGIGDTKRHTLQCHLRINTYIEKIYLFIWWGFLVIALLTLVNFLYYFVMLILWPGTRESSVRHLLKQKRHASIVYSTEERGRVLIKAFANIGLAQDGILLFWFIESHAGPIVARELLGEIFECYKTEMEGEDCENGEARQADENSNSSLSSQSTGSVEDDNGQSGANGGTTDRADKAAKNRRHGRAFHAFRHLFCAEASHNGSDDCKQPLVNQPSTAPPNPHNMMGQGQIELPL